MKKVALIAALMLLLGGGLALAQTPEADLGVVLTIPDSENVEEAVGIQTRVSYQFAENWTAELEMTAVNEEVVAGTMEIGEADRQDFFGNIVYSFKQLPLPKTDVSLGLGLGMIQTDVDSSVQNFGINLDRTLGVKALAEIEHQVYEAKDTGFPLDVNLWARAAQVLADADMGLSWEGPGTMTATADLDRTEIAFGVRIGTKF